MGNPTGFIEIQRRKQPRRPVEERVRDWQEVYLPHPVGTLRSQGARCMDCGIPFCHQGCPLGNFIPDWNDPVYHDNWQRAWERLHATNNFPEWTGRLCPAPCEGACVLGINNDPVTIKSVELAIVERAFDEGWIVPRPPAHRTGRRIAIVGSGPAGLAAADQLNQVGHEVVVLERDDRIGGLLRYGIPEFKMEKRFLDRRLDVMATEGITFRGGVRVGDDVTLAQLRGEYDAVLLAAGAGQPRNLPVPGRELRGVHFAMEYLTAQNRRNEGDAEPDADLTAAGRRVVIIGGGDTGADCLGTAHRQGALSVHQFELMPRPPDERTADNPWPEWPNIFRVSSAHEEGGERVFSVMTRELLGDETGRVRALRAVQVERVSDGRGTRFEPVPGSEFELPVDLVLLAMGFTGPERSPLLTELDLRLTDRGTVWRDDQYMTSVPGIFAAGDMERGQSLIVWALAAGRSAARGIDAHLMGTSDLPAPI